MLDVVTELKKALDEVNRKDKASQRSVLYMSPAHGRCLLEIV